MSQQWDVVGGQLHSRSPGAAGSYHSLNSTAASNGGALIVSSQWQFLSISLEHRGSIEQA
jgi:hypothetical protein